MRTALVAGALHERGEGERLAHGERGVVQVELINVARCAPHVELALLVAVESEVPRDLHTRFSCRCGRSSVTLEWSFQAPMSEHRVGR